VITTAIRIPRARPTIAGHNPKTPIMVKKKTAPTTNVAKIPAVSITLDLGLLWVIVPSFSC
jgi:hypothetical protein